MVPRTVKLIFLFSLSKKIEPFSSTNSITTNVILNRNESKEDDEEERMVKRSEESLEKG